MSPTPTPAPDPGCIELLPIPPQPPRCPDIGTVGDIAGDHAATTSPSGIEIAQDQLQHLPDQADSAALHNLIYPHAGLTPGQIVAAITITVALLALAAIIGWTVHRTRGGAS